MPKPRSKAPLFALVILSILLASPDGASSGALAVFDQQGNPIQTFDPAGSDVAVRSAAGEILAEFEAVDATTSLHPSDSQNDDPIEEVAVEDPDTNRHISPDGSISEATSDLESEVGASEGFQALSLETTRLTIDSMTVGYPNSQYYVPGAQIYLLGGARVYFLSDGSTWNSGAGSYYNYSARLERVEVEGSVVRYVLATPDTGFLIYQQSDFDGGDHSAQGTLAAAGPLVIEATIGSTAAVMRGQAEIVANDETSYGEPRFNYYSAVVGSVVPFELTYTLLSGTWGPTTFDQAFSYSRVGWVDFANPISAPQLIDLELRGPGQVRESATYQYSTFAHYDSGGSREVTSLTEWSVQPASLASIERGALVTYELEGSEAQIMISAAYEEGGVRLSATRDVAIKLEGELETDPTIWETYQGNRRHTGYVPISTDPLDFALRWQRQVGSGRPLNPVTAADGKVFASVKIYFNDETQLFTLDARDGETLWTKQFGAPFSVNPPAFGYGNVYVQTGNHGSDTWLRAYDANTGRELFSSRHSAQWERYFAPTIADGKVYINGGYYGGMYRFDAFSGRQDWFRDLQQYDEWTPAVDDRYAYAYMGEYTPGLYVVDRATGTHAFVIPDENFEWNGWSMNLAPVLGSMNDVIAIHDGRLISFDLGARKIRWEIPASFVGQPSIAKESIYAIDGGRLVARSEASGQLLWSWRPPSGTLLGSIIATDSHIFTRTSTNIYAIDILSQESVWSYPVSGELALGNDTLYIAGSDGMLTAISIPELLPVPPVRLSISGPVSVTEGSATQYKATVEYEDGRIRDRTIRAEWSLAPSDSATIDSRGLLSVGELFTPSETVRINAAYTENGVTVHADVEVHLVIGVALSDFVKRNLEASLAIKERIARDVDEVLKREYAAKAVLAEMSNVGSGYLYRRSLKSLQLAIYWDEFSQIALDRSRAACESALMEFELGATAPPIGRPARAMSR